MKTFFFPWADGFATFEICGDLAVVTIPLGAGAIWRRSMPIAEARATAAALAAARRGGE